MQHRMAVASDNDVRPAFKAVANAGSIKFDPCHAEITTQSLLYSFGNLFVEASLGRPPTMGVKKPIDQPSRRCSKWDPISLPTEMLTRYATNLIPPYGAGLAGQNDAHRKGITVINVARSVQPAPSIASSSSIMPASISRPFFQNSGFDASRPNGASSSEWCFEPPAISIAKYFCTKPGCASR